MIEITLYSLLCGFIASLAWFHCTFSDFVPKLSECLMVLPMLALAFRFLLSLQTTARHPLHDLTFAIQNLEFVCQICS